MNSFQALGVVLLGALSLPCSGSMDSIAQWSAVTVESRVHDIPMKVTARASPEKLVAVTVRYAGRVFQLPVASLADVSSPRLNSINLSYGVLPAIVPVAAVDIPNEQRVARPYFYIELQFGPAVEFVDAANSPREPVFAKAQFLFVAGEYRERWIERPTKPGAWKLESDCKPEKKMKNANHCLLN